ncbi:uncharacterized protein LOC131689182 [Topomyia yanbarensis]|uniref:uncharacterized protein LOC131689182 n=1 Tax=Topomyia yanbarensis TaxID=2498891 RepID=UPI00273B0C47|nr:uncharacterized protein LOC131689182 [Topomyia yanbarensis]
MSAISTALFCGPQEEITAKLAPLIVKSIPLSSLRQEFFAVGIKAKFKLSGIGVKIVLRTKDEYNGARNYLNRIGVEYFSHDVTSENPFEAVVCGLSIMDRRIVVSERRETPTTGCRHSDNIKYSYRASTLQNHNHHLQDMIQ